jgi:2-phospho-L-lactate/phosphoenolpyruvate guanylyltransferase
MWAVVPLKSPQSAKTRLAGVLSPAQRQHLLFELARRVIDALNAARGIEAVAVVTASAEVAAFGRALGARPILQKEETGTASAFAAALNELQSLQLKSVLMIAGDLPLVSAAAVERVIAAREMAVIVPDRHRIGTNALLCSPPEIIPPCFGGDSFRLHLAAAGKAGIRARVLEIDELALDLDCAADLDELQLRCHPASASIFAAPTRVAGVSR